MKSFFLSIDVDEYFAQLWHLRECNKIQETIMQIILIVRVRIHLLLSIASTANRWVHNWSFFTLIYCCTWFIFNETMRKFMFRWNFVNFSNVNFFSFPLIFFMHAIIELTAKMMSIDIGQTQNHKKWENSHEHFGCDWNYKLHRYLTLLRIVVKLFSEVEFILTS